MAPLLVGCYCCQCICNTFWNFRKFYNSLGGTLGLLLVSCCGCCCTGYEQLKLYKSVLTQDIKMPSCLTLTYPQCTYQKLWWRDSNPSTSWTESRGIHPKALRHRSLLLICSSYGVFSVSLKKCPHLRGSPDMPTLSLPHTNASFILFPLTHFLLIKKARAFLSTQDYHTLWQVFPELISIDISA